jgi:hypothetical protein
MSIPTTILSVTINTFRPIGCPYPIDATLALTQGDPGIFSFDGKTLTIKLPSSEQIQITYQLPDPRYVLLGIAFNPPTTGGVGRKEFPLVSLNREAACSQMFVTDMCLEKYNGTSFDYVILVQEVASGNIGLIDPDIETEIQD